MALVDIESEFSEAECAVRDQAHKFAEEVMRPAGTQLDKLRIQPTYRRRNRCCGRCSIASVSSTSTR